MRRLALLASLPLLLAACGGSSTPVSVPRQAPPQQAELGWRESAGEPGSRLDFRVASFAVTDGGWSARITITNETQSTFTVGDPGQPLSRAFGVMIFRTGAEDELKRRDVEQSLPDLRRAQAFEPALPRSLPPGATWSGTMTAPGALPTGLWVRVVFGAFVPTGEMPEVLRRQGVVSQLVWITDHAYRLHG